MKKVILNLQQDRLVFLFIIIGIVLLIFPEAVAAVIPYILGFGLLIYAVVTIVISLKYPDSDAKLGDGIVKAVIGIVILFLDADSLSVIGVIWAVQSLFDAAEEIEEFRESKKFNIISFICIVLSIVFAVMLMMDPFEHFSVHVFILGLEIIVSVFIRRRRLIKRDESEKNKEASAS